MTPEQRIQQTLARSDFLGTRRGLVSTDDLRRYMPRPKARVSLQPTPYDTEVSQ